MVTIDEQTNATLTDRAHLDDDFYESNSNSDSDNDSALMEDAQSEVISSSMTTNGSSSFSEDEQFFIVNKNPSQKIQNLIEEFFKKKNQDKLVRYAKAFGLLNRSYRKQIWPLLINTPSYCTIDYDENRKLLLYPIDYYSAGNHRHILSFSC